MEPDAIIAEIEALDAYQREQFKALYAGLGHARGPLSRPQQYVADAVAEICRCKLTPANWRKLGIAARSDDLYGWLGDQIDGLSETQVKGLVLICLKAAAAALGTKSRIDAVVLLEAIKDLGPAMDHAFPGYWEARLLYRLVPQAAMAA